MSLIRSIVVVSHEFPPLGGGAGKNLAALCAELATRGYSIEVLTEKPPRNEIVPQPFPVVYIPSMRRNVFETRLLSMIFFCIGVIRWFARHREFTGDAILSNMAIPAGLAVSFVIRGKNIPHIVWHHGSDVHGGRPEGAGAFQRLLLKHVWKHASAKCFVSQGLIDFSRRYGMNGCAHLLPIAPIPQSDTHANMCSAGRYFLYLARMEKVKNPLLIPEAFFLICQNEASPDFSVQMVGSGSQERSLRERIALRGCSEYISMQRGVGHEDALQLIGSALALIVPSRIEGFNTTILEAAILGVPVIGANVPGINDFVKHESTGLLFEDNNYHDLAVQMRRLASDRNLRDRLGMNAQRNAGAYSPRVCADSFVHILSVLN